MNSNLKNILEDLRKYFDLYYQAYYNKDLSMLNKINNLREEYQFGKCLSLIEKSKGKETVVYSYIRESFRLIQIGMSPILSQLIEKEI